MSLVSVSTDFFLVTIRDRFFHICPGIDMSFIFNEHSFFFLRALLLSVILRIIPVAKVTSIVILHITRRTTNTYEIQICLWWKCRLNRLNLCFHIATIFCLTICVLSCFDSYKKNKKKRALSCGFVGEFTALMVGNRLKMRGVFFARKQRNMPFFFGGWVASGKYFFLLLLGHVKTWLYFKFCKRVTEFKWIVH